MKSGLLDNEYNVINYCEADIGGTGQVGSAVVAKLLTIPECREVVVIIRKHIAELSRVRNVVLARGRGFSRLSRSAGSFGVWMTK